MSAPSARPGSTPRVPVLAGTAAVLALIWLLFAAATGTGLPDAEVTGQRLRAPVAGPTALPPAATGRDRSSDRDLNIVEIVADDMRVDDLRHAPHLRRLVAARGITLRNAFSSYPLCCPARASFFSGRQAHNHEVLNVRPPYGYRAFDDRRTLATSLQDAGYRTGLVGKYLNGYGADEVLEPDSPDPVVSQFHVPPGWDEWRAAISGARCDPVCGGTYTYFNYAFSDDGVPTSAGRGAYSTTVIGQQARDLARRFHNRRLRTGAPYFLSVNYVAPHNGPGRGDRATRFPFRTADGEEAALGGPAAPRRALEHPRVRAIDRGAGLLRDGRSESSVADKPGRLGRTQPFTPSKRGALRDLARHRAAAVRVMDAQIGRLIAQLKRDREWRRTVVVFWSDNGYYQGEHRRAEGKIDPYEPVLRVPMLVTGPGMRSGATRFDPATVVDLTATVVDIAGAEPPHRPDGRSLLPVLRGRDRGWTTAVLTEAAAWAIEPGTSRRFRDDPRTSVGVRTPRYLYLRHRSGAREIYDLVRDPEQWHNRAADPRWLERNAGIVRALRRTWDRVADCVGVRQCSTSLPPSLRADTETNRAWTQAYFGAVRRARSDSPQR